MVWGLGFGVRGLGFGVWGFGSGGYVVFGSRGYVFFGSRGYVFGVQQLPFFLDEGLLGRAVGTSRGLKWDSYTHLFFIKVPHDLPFQTGRSRWSRVSYLTESDHKAVFQKSTPPQIRQFILYIGNSKG